MFPLISGITQQPSAASFSKAAYQSIHPHQKTLSINTTLKKPKNIKKNLQSSFRSLLYPVVNKEVEQQFLGGGA
jgi:hypothetical protein